MTVPKFQTIKTEAGEVKILLPDLGNIPHALHPLSWALWRAEPERDNYGRLALKPNGRPRIKKAPRNGAGYNVSKSKPEEWASFDACASAFRGGGFSGVGILLAVGSGLVGIDLDEVAELFTTQKDVEQLIRRAKSQRIYCELSPSGRGMRLFVEGTLPGAGRRKGGVELYADRAFLTVTGQEIWPGEIKSAQWLVDGLLEVVGGSDAVTGKAVTLPEQKESSEVDTNELVAWAMECHTQLWAGNWQGSERNYPSQSEADMALVGHIVREAFKRGIATETIHSTAMEVFEKSGLYRPEKRQQVDQHAIPKAMEKAMQHVHGGVPAKDGVPLEIEEVNSRFALIEGVGIYDKARGAYLKTEQFSLLFRNRIIDVGTPAKPQYTTLDKVWLGSNYRAQFNGLEMAPGQGERTRAGKLNTYRGFVIQSRKGDVEPFLKLLEWLITNPADRDFLLKFMAYKVKHPTARYSVAVVLWSRTQGVGKNLIAETWASLFHADHWKVVGQEVFQDQFTDWKHLKLVIVADEVSSTSSRVTADRIKSWVTASSNGINAKNQPKFDEPNLVAYTFLSNHPDAMFFDDTDRRFFVTEGNSQRPPKALIEEFIRWRENGGMAYLLDYFLNLDTGTFNPREPAPLTHAKREMIEDNKSDLERWLERILTAQDIPAILGRDLVTAEELTECYRQETRRDTSSKAMNGALRHAGVTRLVKQARRKDGTRPRVYALAEGARYAAMTDTDLGQVLDANRLRDYS